jgi:hypothetical protein
MSNKRVLISVTNEHWIHKMVVKRMLQLIQDTRYEIRIIMPSHKPYDSDNPPEKNPLDLVALNKDVIGLPTPVTHFDGKGTGDTPVYWNAYDYQPEFDAYKPHGVFKGLRKVDAVGTGCVLFSRRVFEHPEMQKGCFTRKLNPDGTVDKGNDISFCERAIENGFEIYAHYDYFCGHFSEIEINEMVKHYKELFEKQLSKETI